jgi:hypothetical protein
MQTPWGPFRDLDPESREQALSILSADKHQLIEGLVVENTFDQLLSPMTDGDSRRMTPLDIESALIDTRRPDARWLVVVWARTKTVGLGRYLSALEHVAEVFLATACPEGFLARSWRGGQLVGEPIPLEDAMAAISNRKHPPVEAVDAGVRNINRQLTAFWGYLTSTYGDRLWREVVLPRIFMNVAIQPYFRGVWNLDRICVHDEKVWLLEVKHKFPFGGARLKFGINDGELGLMQLMSRAGIRTLYSLIVKPQWSKEIGSMYLLSDMKMRERAAIIGMPLDGSSIARIQQGQTSLSPSHTSFTGRGNLKYKAINAEEFRFLGVLSDGPDKLAAGIEQLLLDKPVQNVTGLQLRQLSVMA